VNKSRKTAIDEIALNPQYFYESDIKVLQTLVHEMVHMWQKYFGTPSRSGYHNREWANKMESVGLIPSHNGLPGGNKIGQNMNDYIHPNGSFDTHCRELLNDRIIEWELKNYKKAGYTFVGVQPDHSMILEVSDVSRFTISQNVRIAGKVYEITTLDQDTGQIGLLPKAEEGSETAIDPEGELFYREKKDQEKIKIKYQCPSCGIRVWGKHGLRILCADCDELLV
jgi:hypothetical protein